MFCRNAGAQNIQGILNELKTDKQKADTLLYYGTNYSRKAKFDSASWCLNKGFPFAKKSKDDQLIAWYIAQQSEIFYFKREFEKGLSLMLKAIPYLSKTSSVALDNNILNFCGRFYENLNRNDSALYYYHQCEIVNNQKDPYRNWLVYYDIAQMFKRADAFIKSEEYFSKAYSLTKPKAIIKDHITVLIEFADLYYLLGKPEKFAPLLEEQKALMSKVKRNYSNDPRHSMFFFLRKKEPLDKKVRFMENVKQQIIKGGNVIKGTQANSYIAQFYEEAGQLEKALDYIRENEAMFKKENDIYNLYNNTKTAYRLLKKTGLTEEAIDEADKLFALKDSMITLQQRGLVMDIETKYKIQKKENDILLLNVENQLSAINLAKEIDRKELLMRENRLKDSVLKIEKNYNSLLASENKLKQAQLVNELKLKSVLSRGNILKENELIKQNKIKWILLSCGFLLLVFGSVIFFMYRRQKLKNLLIQNQADDLQMLMREIHHREKNNLQVISSLLDLQSLTIKDKHASQAIKESRNRVYSMALIHQNLFKEADVIGIGMSDYINNLVESLFQSYNSGVKNIILDTDIDPLVLDVDMVIPIGLVINELVTNSLKYAFKDINSGILHIGFKKLNGELLLTIRDNGVGFPIGMNVFKSESFGFKLVKAFSQKLKARLEVYNDNGACTKLHITKMKFA